MALRFHKLTNEPKVDRYLATFQTSQLKFIVAAVVVGLYSFIFKSTTVKIGMYYHDRTPNLSRV